MLVVHLLYVLFSLYVRDYLQKLLKQHSCLWRKSAMSKIKIKKKTKPQN